MASKYLTEILADYIVETSFEDLPAQVVKAAKMTLLDSITCMIGGLFTPAGKIVAEVISREGGSPESTIPGMGHKTNSLLASLVNSILANALDYDDYYPMSHPGATIIPPALAVSEALKRDGKTFLTSVVVANEVYLRIMKSILSSKEYQKKIFGLGTHQTFGAVIASGKLLNLNRQQMAQGLGIAGSNAPVPSCSKTVWGESVTMVKNNYGLASFTGVLAAKLAQSGFTGPLDLFEGETGFWRMSGSDQFDPEEMTCGLGAEYFITRIGFKPYPCCRWIHSSLDAISAIIKENRIRTDKVEKVEVGTHSLCTIPPFTNAHPKSYEEALFSFKYLIALTLLGIPRGPGWYNKKALTDTNVLSLAEKVSLVEDEEINSCFPDKLLSKVALHMGERTLYRRIDFPKGKPENPMTKEDLEEKFREVTQGLYTEAKSIQFLETINNIEKVKDMNVITAFYSPLILEVKNSKT